MPAVCRVGDSLSTGHGCDGTTVLATPGQGTVFADGILVARVTDPTVSHQVPAGVCVPHVQVVNAGSPTVFVEGKAVARIGDSADAGQMTGGSTTVFINGTSNPPPPPAATLNITPANFFTGGLQGSAVSYPQNIFAITHNDVPEGHPPNPEQVDTATEFDPSYPVLCGQGQDVNAYDLAVTYLQGGANLWKELNKVGGRNPMIEGLWDEIGYNGAQYADETAWCAVFVGAVLKRCNLEFIKTASSQAYKNYGLKVSSEPLGTGNDLGNAKRGDLIVFYRKGQASGLGHIGFFTGNYTDTTVDVLGGNQGDTLSVRTYKREDAAKGWGIRTVRRPVSCLNPLLAQPESGSVPVDSTGFGGGVT